MYLYEEWSVLNIALFAVRLVFYSQLVEKIEAKLVLMVALVQFFLQAVVSIVYKLQVYINFAHLHYFEKGDKLSIS